MPFAKTRAFLLVCALALAAIAIGGCVSGGPPVDDIKVSFRLDPRLTKSLYMGERWVSPPTFTPVAQEGEVAVAARAEGVTSGETPPAIDPMWSSADESILRVSPGRGAEVTLTVLAPGATTLTVEGGGASRTLHVQAVKTPKGALRVRITK